MNRRITLLFAGATLLLIASAGIILARLLPTSGPGQTDQPMVGIVRTSTAATVSPTTITSPSQIATPRVIARTTVTSAGVTISPAAATATRRPSTTPGLPTVTNGGCAVSLPRGYGIDPTQRGYYPANDHTGFVALDSFANNSGTQTPETLAQAFATGTLNRALTDYHQTGAVNLGDRYRIDYTATAAGQRGRGSIYVQLFGTLGCGVTTFALETATGSLAATLDVLVGSLEPLLPTRPGTATPGH